MRRYSDLFRSAAGGPAVAAEEVKGPDAGAQAESDERFALLFVDDEDGVLAALRRAFLDENYDILTAASAGPALEILGSRKVHLVVSDHRMPGMTGAELLREIKRKWPDTIRIMLTGHADVGSIMGAVNEGAVYKFITKPWNDEDLRLTVSLALQQYALVQENRKLKEIARKQDLKIRNYSALYDENRVVLGNILTKTGVVAEGDAVRALKERREGETLGESLVRLGVTTESRIVHALQKHLNIDFIDLAEAQLSPGVVKFLPRELCERSRLLPVRLEGKQITVAMADPSDILKCDHIALLTGLKVVPLIGRNSDILAQLRLVYGEAGQAASTEGDDISLFEPLDEVDIVIEEEEKEASVQELLGSAEVPSIIRIVNAIISEAVRYRASDIHIEPKTKHSVVRFRIDGILHGKIRIPTDLHNATVSRVKILAKMDIAERRKPQDGRITVKAGARIVDIRVSTMPTITGEKVVLRILDKNAAIKRIDELGVLPDDLVKINNMVRKPQGVIIATGPTGSGKTTMLYSILSAMLQGSRNFETIEDPVEYFLDEASQVHIRDKIGLSFASVLRSTLRQDPDVILVGEMRDAETADVVFKASLTGHMVLSTLHTNNSVASITRLMDMGVKPYIIASALEGILAQRLVRKICRHCRVEEPPDATLMEMLKIPIGSLGTGVYRGRGCERCDRTGYLGRTGIYEVFLMNDDFRHLVSGAYRESELANLARGGGMRTLVEDGIEKVRLGETTLEELVRVVGPQIRHERRCTRCERMIDAKYVFCPFCGTFRQHFCMRCRVPLERDWRMCPFCGKSAEAIEPANESEAEVKE